jgi:hypothetical protein
MLQPGVKGITDVPGFINSRLAELSSPSNLYALFASYNDIPNYIGAITSSRADLDIVVQEGYLIAAIDVATMGLVALSAGDFDTAALASEHLRSEGREAQASLEKKVSQIPLDRPVLVVIYAGLSAWQESLDFATTIKAQNDRATIVVVTCDCRLDKKIPVFQQLLAESKIDDVVVDSQCGGRRAMSEIIKSMSVS